MVASTAKFLVNGPKGCRQDQGKASAKPTE